MTQLHEYQTPEGFWTCDVGITAQEWLQLLRDEEIQEKDYISVLLKLYREPGHGASCKQLEKKYGRKYQYYNNAVTNFGKWVQNKLGRFEIVGDGGEKRYWPTAVYGSTSKNLFTWYVKKELCEALHQYLLENLIAQYKKEVLPRGLRSRNAYEIYKWELITRCQGQSADFILSAHLQKDMNLIDRQFDGPALTTLLKTDNEQVQACFNKLLEADFEKAYHYFKESIDALTKDRWKYVISDERMAASFLACADPDNYTFYKAEIYGAYCRYMGYATMQAGSKYEHYQSLLPEIISEEEKDEEIMDFIASETEGLLQSRKLNAQDILWQMKEWMKEQVAGETMYTWVPFLREFAEKLLDYRKDRKALLDLFYGIDPELVRAYQEEGKPIEDITPFTVLGTLAVGKESRRTIFAEYYKKALDIKADIPTDYVGFPSLHPQRVMFIYGANKAAHTEPFWELFKNVLSGKNIKKAFDEVMKIKGVDRNITMGLFWIDPEHYLSLDGTNEDYLVHYGFDKIVPKQKRDFDYYSNLMQDVNAKMASGKIKEQNYLEFSTAAYSFGGNNTDNNTDEYMDNSFYSEIAEALEGKKNVILQGAPGTGKTYAIPEVVTRLCKEDIDYEDRDEVMDAFNKLVDEKRVVFTTFHQSMDYEDFIEGLKPEVDDAGNVQYKVQNGIFKALCKSASAPIITNNQIELGEHPTIWKVSLAGTYDNEVRSDCLKNGYIRIGWDAYGAEPDEQTVYSDGGKIIVDTFINKMEIGDIVMSCYTNKLVDGVGVITGDYEWRDDFKQYKRVRRVKWLVKGIKEDITPIIKKTMTLSTVYRLNDMTVEDVLGILKKYDAAGKTTAEKNVKPYVIVIDEINRGNVAKIFGELITLIEADKRAGAQMPLKVKLPYSKEDFSIPSNVYLLATMNTADRSLSQFDYAMRRRFRMIPLQYGFVELNLDEDHEFMEDIFREVTELFISNFDEYLENVNVRLKPADTFSLEFNPADLWPGQSMFIVRSGDKSDIYSKIFYEIIPTLEQYILDGVFTDSDKVYEVIDHLKEVALGEE